VVLKSWRAAPCFTDGRLTLNTVEGFTEHMNRASWSKTLERYGPVPGHLTTVASHRQAMDLITELVTRSGVSPRHTAYGLGYHVWLAVKTGKTIRSLGFVAEKLIRRIAEGDDTWVYDLPSLRSQDDLDGALAWARRFIGLGKQAGVALNERALTSTLELEMLADLIAAGRATDFATRVRCAAAPGEGQSVCGWTYFESAPASPRLVPSMQAADSEHKPDHTAGRRVKPKARVAPQDPHLVRLFEADVGEILAAKLLKDASGLRAFLATYGRLEDGSVDLFGEPTFAEALAVMESLLRSPGDHGRGTLNSWRSFRKPVVRALQRSEAARRPKAA
jgi:hypothetical protein